MGPLRLEPGKDQSIETLRGLAILLMVAGHVVGARPEFAMQVPDHSPWRFVFWGFQDIRMPLFTVISGWLYAARPIRDWGQLPSLVKGKARRLIIPLLFVGTLLFWTKLVTPGTNSKPEITEFWRPYIVGMDHLWFLQAIFLIFLAVAVLELVGTLTTLSRWLATTAVTATLFVVVPVAEIIDVFSVGGAVRLLPFFLIGLGMRRFRFEGRPGPGVLAIVLVVLMAAYVPRILSVYGVWGVTWQADNLLAVAVGVPAVLLLFWFRHRLSNRPLAWIGQYAFGIYLLHYFAYSAARILLRAGGIESHLMTFVLGVLAGVSLPILFQIVTRRMPLVRLMVFGEKTSSPPQRVASIT